MQASLPRGSVRRSLSEQSRLGRPTSWDDQGIVRQVGLTPAALAQGSLRCWRLPRSSSSPRVLAEARACYRGVAPRCVAAGSANSFFLLRALQADAPQLWSPAPPSRGLDFPPRFLPRLVPPRSSFKSSIDGGH